MREELGESPLEQRLRHRVVPLIVSLTEELAGDDLGDRLAKANAKVCRKTYDALRGEKFTREEAVGMTAAIMGKK